MAKRPTFRFNKELFRRSVEYNVKTMFRRSMEDAERYRQIRRELFCDFKESAVGMMENIQDAEDRLEQILDRIEASIRRDNHAGKDSKR